MRPRRAHNGRKALLSRRTVENVAPRTPTPRVADRPYASDQRTSAAPFHARDLTGTRLGDAEEQGEAPVPGAGFAAPQPGRAPAVPRPARARRPRAPGGRGGRPAPRRAACQQLAANSARPTVRDGRRIVDRCVRQLVAA